MIRRLIGSDRRLLTRQFSHLGVYYKSVKLSNFVTNANLANQLNIRYNSLSKVLKNLGFEDNQLASDYILDNETAGLVAQEFGYSVISSENENDLKHDIQAAEVTTDSKKLKPRPPIVTIMGHVDHGKTTILDYLRKSSITKSEFGGITQHIGAFSVKTPITNKVITFLDTPGHAAFLKMRERGANVTDIVILVVAADDSVKPQTIEAIKHCQKHGVDVIVAINKCDKPNGEPKKVLNDLSAHGIFTEEFGGDIQVVRVSGLTGMNMDKLEEEVVALSEILDLKAEEKNVLVEGHVIESQVKKGVGAAATVLVTRGTLKNGCVIVAGKTWAKVKALKNEHNEVVKAVKPGNPIEVYGWKDLPEAGDLVLEVKKEAKAKSVVAYRIEKHKNNKQKEELDDMNRSRQEQRKQLEKNEKLKELFKYGLSKEDLKARELELEETPEAEKAKVIPFIVKADVSGSNEAILGSITSIGNEEVMPLVIYSEVGPPNETDLDRAETAGATIICFNVAVPKEVASSAEKKGVKILNFTVIYHLVEEVTLILSSYLKPLVETKITGGVEIKEVFTITNPKTKSKFKIAGCKVQSGEVERNCKVMVKRKDLIVFKGLLEGIKQGKEDVQSARKGTECGINFKDWEEFQPGDFLEVYEEKEIERYL